MTLGVAAEERNDGELIWVPAWAWASEDWLLLTHVYQPAVSNQAAHTIHCPSPSSSGTYLPKITETILLASPWTHGSVFSRMGK